VNAETFKAIWGKKVAGIPFAALALIVVVGALGYSMWRQRGAVAPSAAEDATAEGDTEDSGQPLFLANPVPSQPSAPGILSNTGQPPTNDDWLRLGIEWAQKNKGVSATEAQRVLSDYLNGSAQSWQDGQVRDAVIAAIGLPPELPSAASPTGPQTLARPVLSVKSRGRKVARIVWTASPGASGYRLLFNGKTHYTLSVNTLDYLVKRGYNGSWSVQAYSTDPKIMPATSNAIRV